VLCFVRQTVGYVLTFNFQCWFSLKCGDDVELKENRSNRRSIKQCITLLRELSKMN